jgi:hypothetical protein
MICPMSAGTAGNRRTTAENATLYISGGIFAVWLLAVVYIALS